MANDDPGVPADATEERSYRVTPATIDDLDTVTDLWVDLARSQRRHGSTLLAAENRPAVREWVAQSAVSGELLVAREGNTDGNETAGESADTTDEPLVLGFVGFTLERDGYERDRTRGTVSNLYVRPNHRGEGIGAALLAAAERALTEAGADAVALEALADNDQARSFYTDHGYTPNRVELVKPLADDATADEESGDVQ
ncbi:MAG: GNAT family N-acetyltransferase [Halorubrum sp.]